MASMAPENSSSWRRFASLLIFIGVVVLAGGLLFAYLSRSGTLGTANHLPRTIAGYELKTATYGSEAVAEIARMHGKEFPTTSGAMGMYGDTNQISLWIEGFQDRSTASQIIHAMGEKIALGKSPFSPTGQQKAGHRTVYLLDGMGQKHVYFQSGNLVLWLAAEPTIADQAIQQILEDYP